jgi:hypothetical protein
MRRHFTTFSLIAFASGFLALSAVAADWIRAGQTTNSPMWGLEGRLQFGIHPARFDVRRNGGPRGLIRLAYPVLPDGGCTLINYIAVEPIVDGKKGFSELERSAFDQRHGKLFWTGNPNEPAVEQPQLDPGTLRTVAPGVEELSVTVFVQKFDNGAHVRLTLSQRSDAPDELKLTVEAEPDSAPLEQCILTATMGNQTRARLLFLNDGPVSSLQLYPDYRDQHFAPHRIFPLDRLSRAANGDVLVSIASDEEDPSAVSPFGRPHAWDYRGAKVTQYWRKPAGAVTSDLVAAVNARFTYWGGERPIPGGISFENFELREPFESGQSFIFGITKSAPSLPNR